ncbi:LOW QUALITY PROTEIN: leucine-rich repeat transmembrane neuronal protein 3 [Drosophila sulfurigaster albostrigata]|uniref:LOW QUALITY PROTEIN: leucine-rich repeat transmembrane neuronal protein 3 n=1 Tax=Drosophila sulfurigaster albostrigata TaxID=89887 RepID=UPI002D21ECEB|nr:LOW QUALITY PROTEIN: leucine-rich repeat transmembrane neuronal protein 3 [Drosophila sulfurigaster albostrigata]
MKTVYIYMTFVISMIVFLLPLNSATEKSENGTTVPPETTLKPKTEVLKSDICTKCSCDAKNSLIDCSRKLANWFSPEEWEILQNGDITFETMKLSYNNLTNIPALPTYGVKKLFLDYNSISSITIGAFQNLTELTKLDLSNNQLTSKALIPDVFKGPYSVQDFEPLKNLKSLNLGYNRLHLLDDDLFEHVPYLEELILCSNSFQVIDKQTETALSGCSSLKVLDISYMELKTLPETIFHGPQDLDTLIVSGNLFDKIPKAFDYADNLKRLVLDENPIGNLEGDNIFPAMSSLQYLSCAFMPNLFKIGSGALSELQNLTELILSDNTQLIEIDSHAMCKNVTGGDNFDYPPLEKLYLNNCNLTVLPRDLIVRWDKLHALDLRYNPWLCDISNEYMVNYLIQHVNKSTPILASNVICENPTELKGLEVLNVSNNKLLGVLPSGASWVWIGLIIVLLSILVTLSGLLVYRRGYCGIGKKKESARRALYSRTSFNEDFHI